MNERCSCGRPMIVWAGDLEETCAESRSLPGSCECAPLHVAAEPDADGGKDRFPRIDWHEAFAADFSSVDWLPGRFMERGQQVSLVGDGKVGKSLFAAEWLWRAVTGRSFLGDEARAVLKVLYFDRENSLRDIVTRMQAFGANADDLREQFDYRMFPRFNGSLNESPAAALELLEIVADVKPDVVVLDTVSRFITGNENDSGPWLDLYRRVHAPLKRDGIATFRLDHFGKDADRGSRGSSAKSQDADHVWELTRLSEQRDAQDDGGELVTTLLKLRRTHTRTGIGADELAVTREACKAANGMWMPGRTSHRLAEPGAVSAHQQEIQGYVDTLLRRGAPAVGRVRLAEWAGEFGVELPRNTAKLAQVVAELKKQKAG